MLARACLVAMLVAACGNDVGTDEPGVPDDLATPSDSTVFAGPLCEFSSVGEGPCSLACDPDALIDQYVPPGTCIAFECPHLDGSTTRVGGCNL